MKYACWPVKTHFSANCISCKNIFRNMQNASTLTFVTQILLLLGFED